MPTDAPEPPPGAQTARIRHRVAFYETDADETNRFFLGLLAAFVAVGRLWIEPFGG